MTRRGNETLWGSAVGMAIGWGVWKLAQAHLPHEPFHVDRWTVGTCAILGAFAGALVPFYAFNRDTPAWRRMLATRLLMAGVIAVAAFTGARAHVVEHPSDNTMWAVGFGARLPDCECPEDRAACVQWRTTPENVRACWGDTNVFAVSALAAVSVTAGAMIAAALASLLVLSRALERTRVLQADAAAPPRVLERIVRGQNPLLDYADFQRRLAALSRRVCRIQIGSRPLGTGFLIGKDLVLTNHHVLEPVYRGQAPVSAVRCVFDAIGPESTAQTRPCALAPAWDVAHSPPSQVDLMADPKTGDPGPDELDFAVVRLTDPVGDDPGPQGPRGWVAIPDSFFVQPGDPLVILQHPGGRPLHVAVDTEAVLSVNASENRIRYRTNTEPGSSGSPCFDLSLQTLLALHHSGDPGFRPAYNEGIPIHKIRQRLAAIHLP